MTKLQFAQHRNIEFCQCIQNTLAYIDMVLRQHTKGWWEL